MEDIGNHGGQLPPPLRVQIPTATILPAILRQGQLNLSLAVNVIAFFSVIYLFARLLHNLYTV